jgi:hypothetical protein
VGPRRRPHTRCPASAASSAPRRGGISRDELAAGPAPSPGSGCPGRGECNLSRWSSTSIPGLCRRSAAGPGSGSPCRGHRRDCRHQAEGRGDRYPVRSTRRALAGRLRRSAARRWSATRNPPPLAPRGHRLTPAGAVPAGCRSTGRADHRGYRPARHAGEAHRSWLRLCAHRTRARTLQRGDRGTVT